MRNSFGNKALWVLGAGLLANAAAMVYTHATGHAPDLILAQPAYGQVGPTGTPGGALLGARGLYFAPGQIGPDAYGVYLMDVDSQTICVYRTDPGNSRFKLMASRSFKNDRFLEDFNTDTPTPKQVEDLVNKQRQRMAIKNDTNTPTVDQNPKPDENLPEAPK